MKNNYLKHYGVKGMKWGVRKDSYSKRSSNNKASKSKTVNKSKNGDRIISKGSTLYRISRDPNDITSSNSNRKYYSTNKSDNEQWKNIIGKYGETHSFKYTITKDLKIAKATKAGKILAKMKLEASKDNYKDFKLTSDMLDVMENTNVDFNNPKENNNTYISSLLVYGRTESGKQIVDRMMSEGYSGMEDAFGNSYGNGKKLDSIMLFDNANKHTKKKTR